MQPASLVGFALVFLVLGWGLSLAAALGVRASARRLRAGGAAIERAVLEVAVIAPPALAAGVTIVLMARSASGSDHCLDHGHHAHLCLIHGVAWVDRAWVVALVALAGTAFAVRAALVVGALVQGRRLVGAIGGVARSSGDVQQVDAAVPFCFVAGLRRPRIYVSAVTWAALDARERAAVLAHERAHIAHRDLWRRLGFEVFLVTAAPLVSWIVRRRWIAATEKLRDADAAAAVGSGADVAQAMITMARLGAAGHRGWAGFVGPGDVVAERVESLLGGRATGRRAGRLAIGASMAAAIAAVIAAAAAAGSLHHLFETLLG